MDEGEEPEGDEEGEEEEDEDEEEEDEGEVGRLSSKSLIARQRMAIASILCSTTQPAICKQQLSMPSIECPVCMISPEASSAVSFCPLMYHGSKADSIKLCCSSCCFISTYVCQTCVKLQGFAASP